MSRVAVMMTACFLSIAVSASAGDWLDIGDGIRYKKLAIRSAIPADANSPKPVVHFFKIDTLKFRLDAATSEQLGKDGVLFIQSGEVNKISAGKGWIFQMRYLKPQIIPKKEYRPIPDIEMAVEAGPRILADGKIPDGLPADRAERSAIGIDPSGRVMFIVTESYPATLTEFAKILKGELCYDALILESGDSIGLHAKVDKFELDIGGSKPIADGIGVFRRDKLERRKRSPSP